MQRKFWIRGFWRFKDDVLVSLDCSYPLYKRRMANIFEIEVECISKKSVEMLALALKIESGNIEALPRVKPPGPTLSLSSGHPKACLQAWPSAAVGTLEEDCSHPQYHLEQLGRLHSRVVAKHDLGNWAEPLTKRVG